MKQINRQDLVTEKVTYEGKHFEPVSYRVDGRSSSMEKSPEELLKQIRKEDLERQNQQSAYYGITRLVAY